MSQSGQTPSTVPANNEMTILFSSDITPNAVNNFAGVLAAYAANGVTRLIIGMNSSGGNVVAGVFLHNTLRTMPFEVVMHNIGNVDSIANVVFLAGSVRRASQNATFMFHGVGFESVPTERLEEKNLKEKLDTIQSEHTRLARIIASRSNLREKSVRALFAKQSTRSAQWAMQNGLVTEIAEFQFPTNRQFYTFFGN